MSKILLENMEFFAYHGCFKEEQIIGNQFVVNIEIETDTSRAELSDNLQDTLNYQNAYNIVREQMKQNSYLLEHVGQRVTSALMDHFEAISHLKVKISKMHPPMGGKMKSVSLVLERHRSPGIV